MADQDLKALTATTTPADADLMYTVVDPSGLPLDRKITWTTVKAFLKTYFDGVYGSVASVDGKKPYHGVVARPVGATNPLPTHITSTIFTLGATANPISYYYQGTLVNVTSDKTTTLAAAAGLYFIYFDSTTGNLANSTTLPGFDSNSNVIVATVLFNGSNYGLVNDERHSYSRDAKWHTWAHATVGTRYRSGITLTHNSGTGSAATFATTSGEIWDEDIKFVVNASSAFPTINTARILYQTSASLYSALSAVSAIPFHIGANQRPNVVKASDFSINELLSAANRYANFFVYATTDLHTPIYIITESVSDATLAAGGYTSLANARAVPFPNLLGLGISPELKPIYRIIVRADGVVQAIDTTQDDYRLVSSLPQGAGTTSTTAGSVTFNPAGGISATNAQTALEELDSETVKLNQASAQTIGATGARLAKLWATDIETINMPTVGGASLSTLFIAGIASAKDNAVPRFDSTTGKLVQDSDIIISDLTAGAIIITTPALSGTGTKISIIAGNSTDTTGGILNLQAGNATTGNTTGGDLTIRPGAKAGSGADGSIIMFANPTATVGAIFNLALIASTSKTFTFPNATGIIALTSDVPTIATQAEVVTGTDDTKYTTSLAVAPYANQSLYHQAIINGNFDVWQRGTTMSFVGGGATKVLVDRWQVYAIPNITVSRELASLSGSNYCARYQRNLGETGVTATWFAQGLETVNTIPFRGKKVTVSFYARAGANYSSTLGNLSARIASQTGTETDIFGGTGTLVEADATFQLTTSWQKFTLTSTSIIGTDKTQLSIYFNQTPVGTAGAADYYEIAQVQLCAGSVALPFQPKSFAEELRAINAVG